MPSGLPMKSIEQVWISVHLVKAEFQQAFQERWALLSGVLTQVFFGFLFEAIVRALQGQKSPSEMQALVAVVWIGQALYACVVINADTFVSARILSGDLAYELLRPTRLSLLWGSRILGRKAATLFVRGSIVFGLAALCGRIPVEGLSDVMAAFLVASGSCLLSASLSLFVSVLVIHTEDARGISGLFYAASTLFSGVGIPVALMPAWYQSVVAVLPFQALVHLPSLAVLGQATISQVFLMQCAWTVICLIGADAILQRGLRRVSLVGG